MADEGVFPSDGNRLCGVIHLPPSPGSAGWGRRGASRRSAADAMSAMLERARADARAYAEGGIRTLIVENFHDAPFDQDQVAPATSAAMALAVQAAMETEGISAVGVNVLRNDAMTALGVAAATGAQFIRVNVHTGLMATDQGIIEGRSAATLRERARLGLDHVRILGDVHVKHATPFPGERLEDAARDALHRGGADALVVSGVATGSAPDTERVETVRKAVGEASTILVGSGLSVSNARALLSVADGAIVGSALKENGVLDAPVHPPRVVEIVELLRESGPA